MKTFGLNFKGIPYITQPGDLSGASHLLSKQHSCDLGQVQEEIITPSV